MNPACSRSINQQSKQGRPKITNPTTSSAPDHRIPVAILTGFLGAGKTTCLNAFLRSPEASRTAVLVNEFGEIDIDGAVLAANLGDGSRLVTLPNGCVCCAVQEDLAEALLALAARARSDPITRCVVETTGLADPGAIIRGVRHDPRLRQDVFAQSTVTVCAADRLLDQLSRFEEPARQIGIADRIVITKTDLASPEDLTQVRDAIERINPLAEIHISTRGGIANLFTTPDPAAGSMSDIDSPPDHGHHHSHSVQTFTVRIGKPLDPDRFRDVMSFLIMRHAEKLLRVKGIVRFAGDDAPRVLNGVHDVFSTGPADPDVQAPREAGAIVFIGIDLPRETIVADIKSCEVSK